MFRHVILRVFSVFSLSAGIEFERHLPYVAQGFIKRKTPASMQEFLWAVLNLFRTTSFPKIRGKYGTKELPFQESN